jgi:hypothetical protein
MLTVITPFNGTAARKTNTGRKAAMKRCGKSE